jgi:hypothetical protein
MSFNIQARPTFRRTVKVRVPDTDGAHEETMVAVFKVATDDELKGVDLDTEAGTIDFCRRIVVRLDDLADADKKPVEFTPEVFEQVLAMPHARVALVRTYTREVLTAAAGN